MKKETVEKGLNILRSIDFSEYRVKKLQERKNEYSQIGYFKIDGGFDLDIKIPFEFFESWFDSEVGKEQEIINALQKELDEL